MEIKQTKAVEILPLEEFMKKEFPGKEPIIEGLLRREEMIIFSATAKTGKSLMVTNLALKVATGEPWLDKFKTTKGRVLYWQTEVSDERLQSRLRAMTETL